MSKRGCGQCGGQGYVMGSPAMKCYFCAGQSTSQDPVQELAAAKASTEGAWLSPAAQALYEQEGADRFGQYHRGKPTDNRYDPEFREP